MLTFEVWIKRTIKGTFLTQEKAELVDCILAESQAHADKLASEFGGYAVLKI